VIRPPAFVYSVLKLVARKLIQGLLMILVVSAVTFTLLSTAGGDALSSLRENPQVSEETIENLRRIYGLDRPVAVRYASWLGGAFTGDLGDSLFYRTPVGGLVINRLSNTLLLTAAALLIALFVAVGLSVLSARFPNRPLEYLIESLILIFASTPRIVLALLILALSAAVAGLTVGGPSRSFTSLMLTAFALASPLIAVFLAQAHEQLTRAMNEDFIRLARAKGLSEGVVIVRHASRAALNPLLTLFGLSLGGLIGGSVIVETILGWPGLGSLMVSAVRGRDVPLVMGIVLVASAAVWLGNTIAEVLQMMNDKRLRAAEDI
jgi:peptide/nickel transport system permease protein